MTGRNEETKISKQLNELSERINMTANKWENIIKNKNDFWHRKIEDIRNIYAHIHPDIVPDILDSWNRSLQAGLSPHGNKFPTVHRLVCIILADDSDCDDIQQALDIVKQMFNEEISQKFYPLSYQPDEKEDGIKHLEILVQKFFSEEISGTTAHSLVRRLGHPIQIIGSEHFCYELSKMVATAAPVYNKAREMIMIISLVLPIPLNIWNNDAIYTFNALMRLVTAIANVITEKLQEKNQLKPKALLSQFEGLLDNSSEPAFLCDIDGNIIDINETAASLLTTSQDAAKSQNINKFLDNFEDSLTQVVYGESCIFETTLNINDKKHRYFVKAHPIRYGNRHTVVGMHLKLVNNNVNVFLKEKTKEKKLTVKSDSFKGLVGKHPLFEGAKNNAKLFAMQKDSILLLGETGTGKEMFAQAIHNYSNPNGPFIAVNCAAIPESLIVSELFGYEMGSFTGADKKGKPGKFELANGGTLFLDEIGEMPYEMQSVFLRVLQDKYVTRIGAAQSKAVDFRVIAATNQNITELIQKKKFRADLFYRLSVFTMTLPALRERRQDIPLLIQYFIKAYSSRNNCPELDIDPSVVEFLSAYSWPGNIRQLSNVITYAATMAHGRMILAKHLPKMNDPWDMQSFLGTNTVITDKSGSISKAVKSTSLIDLSDAERGAIQYNLKLAGGNIGEAAKYLGISKSTLYRKMKKYGMTSDDC